MSNNTGILATTTTAAPASAGVASPKGPLARFAGVRWGDYLGVAPFLIFAILFLIVPTLFLIVGAFIDDKGGFTLQNIIDLGTPQILNSF